MNRRDFLKTSALATSAALVCLPGEFTDKLPEGYINPADWFRENKVWLRKWFEKSDMKPYNDWIVDGHTMQIFKDEATIIYSKGLHPPIMKELYSIHMDSILLACIFGVEDSHGTIIDGYPAPRTMSGFFEQTGRYPTKKDKILVQYISLFRRYKYHRLLWDGGHSEWESDVIFSELRIKVL